MHVFYTASSSLNGQSQLLRDLRDEALRRVPASLVAWSAANQIAYVLHQPPEPPTIVVVHPDHPRHRTILPTRHVGSVRLLVFHGTTHLLSADSKFVCVWKHVDGAANYWACETELPLSIPVAAVALPRDLSTAGAVMRGVASVLPCGIRDRVHNHTTPGSGTALMHAMLGDDPSAGPASLASPLRQAPRPEHNAGMRNAPYNFLSFAAVTALGDVVVWYRHVLIEEAWSCRRASMRTFLPSVLCADLRVASDPSMHSEATQVLGVAVSAQMLAQVHVFVVRVNFSRRDDVRVFVLPLAKLSVSSPTALRLVDPCGLDSVMHSALPVLTIASDAEVFVVVPHTSQPKAFLLQRWLYQASTMSAPATTTSPEAAAAATAAASAPTAAASTPTPTPFGTPPASSVAGQAWTVAAEVVVTLPSCVHIRSVALVCDSLLCVVTSDGVISFRDVRSLNVVVEHDLASLAKRPSSKLAESARARPTDSNGGNGSNSGNGVNIAESDGSDAAVVAMDTRDDDDGAAGADVSTESDATALLVDSIALSPSRGCLSVLDAAGDLRVVSIPVHELWSHASSISYPTDQDVALGFSSALFRCISESRDWWDVLVSLLILVSQDTAYDDGAMYRTTPRMILERLQQRIEHLPEPQRNKLWRPHTAVRAALVSRVPGFDVVLLDVSAQLQLRYALDTLQSCSQSYEPMIRFINALARVSSSADNLLASAATDMCLIERDVPHLLPILNWGVSLIGFVLKNAERYVRSLLTEDEAAAQRANRSPIPGEARSPSLAGTATANGLLGVPSPSMPSAVASEQPLAAQAFLTSTDLRGQDHTPGVSLLLDREQVVMMSILVSFAYATSVSTQMPLQYSRQEIVQVFRVLDAVWREISTAHRLPGSQSPTPASAVTVRVAVLKRLLSPSTLTPFQHLSLADLMDQLSLASPWYCGFTGTSHLPLLFTPGLVSGASTRKRRRELAPSHVYDSITGREIIFRGGVAEEVSGTRLRQCLRCGRLARMQSSSSDRPSSALPIWAQRWRFSCPLCGGLWVLV